jgi:NADH dehydrogenase
VGLKWIEEGVTIRLRAEKMIAAAMDSGAAANFLVVGGGYTGIEAAGHLAYLAKARTGLPYREIKRFARIVIVEKCDKVLRNVSDKARSSAEELLDGYAIEVVKNTTVDRFAEGEDAVLTNGRVLERPLVIWAAGVVPGPAVAAMASNNEDSQRLAVDEHLRLPGSQSVFAAGDVAWARASAHEEGLRMSVQFAISGGRVAAANVKRAIAGEALRRFDPFDLGYLVPLAPGHAAGVVLGRDSSGLTPFMLHYFMCVFRSRGYQNRKSILGDLWKELMTDGKE